MQQYRLPPGAGWGFLAVVALAFFALVFIPARVAGESFERLGLTMVQGLVVLGCMLFWRTASVTVHLSKKLVPQTARRSMQAAFMDMQGGREGSMDHTGELVRQRFALGVGGCLVPLLMCLYFATGITDFTLALPWLSAAVSLVAVVCFAALKLVPGQGMRVPMFIPPLAVGVASMVLRGQLFAPQVAYIAAVLGTLIGAGLVPVLWPRMRKQLDAPSVILGGPGVFGGLFLACLAAGLFS